MMNRTPSEEVSSINNNFQTIEPADILQGVSTNPSDYFTEVTNNNNLSKILFSFYEEKQGEMYSIIQQNNPEILVEVDMKNNKYGALESILKNKKYNKNRICLKFKTDITCLSSNTTIDYYFFLYRRDSKNEEFYSLKHNKSYIYNSDPFGSVSNKQLMLLVNGINSYLFDNENYDQINIDTSIANQITDDIGSKPCNCTNEPFICAEFGDLADISLEAKKILFSMYYVNQGLKADRMSLFYRLIIENFGNINSYLQKMLSPKKSFFKKNVEQQPMYEVSISGIDTIGKSTYYVDSKNKTFVYCTCYSIVISINGDEPYYIPLYKVFSIFPLELNRYCYEFYYIDNEPPYVSNANKPIFTIDDFRNVLLNRLMTFIDILSKTPDLISQNKREPVYTGQDYLDYMDQKVGLFEHKVYEQIKQMKYNNNERVPDINLLDKGDNMTPNPIYQNSTGLYTEGGKRTRRGKKSRKSKKKKSRKSKKNTSRKSKKAKKGIRKSKKNLSI